MLLALALACAPKAPAPPPEGVKVHGNLPVLTASELAAEDAARDACLQACAEEPCRTACFDTHPIRQVEVVPDAPVAPTP